MPFFEPPEPEPEAAAPAPYQPPLWTGPSELVLGTWVPAQRLLGKNDRVAVVLRGLCAYPNGFEVNVSFLGRPPHDQQLHQQFFTRFHSGRGPRIGFAFSDGRRTGQTPRRFFDATRDENGVPTEPVLLPRGGGGGGGEYRQTFWVAPLPPPGRLVLYFDWPDQGVGETTVELDATELADAGRSAIELWPSGREPTADTPTTRPRRAWQSLTSFAPPPAPFPADSVGPKDVAAAERAVRTAFETVYSSKRSDRERLALIEGGAALATTMEQSRQARQRFRGTSEMDISVERIAFTDTERATVDFVLLFPAEPLSQLPSRGTAVLDDATWKVARHTYCALVESLGVECPPPE